MSGGVDSVVSIVSLGAGTSQLPLILCAKRLGHRVIGVDRDPGAPGLAECDARVVASTHDPAAVLEGLARLAREGGPPPTAVLTRSSGPPVATGAEVAAALGLPGLDVARARLSTSKPGFGELCAEADVPWAGRGLAANAAEAGPVPFVVKPARTVVGKRGVVVVRDAAAAEDAIARARAASQDGTALVEDLVEGEDVALVVLFGGGDVAPVALLDERVGFGPDGEAHGLGFALPSAHAGTAAGRRVAELGSRLCTRMGTGIGFLAFRIPPDGSEPTAIEAHFELAGDRVADELLVAAGFDAFAAAIRLHVEGVLPDPWPALAPAAVEGPAS